MVTSTTRSQFVTALMEELGHSPSVDTSGRSHDWDEARQMLSVSRRQVRGEVAPVSREKRAPKEYPVQPELAEVLRWQRQRMLSAQAPGLAEGWMFPTSTGTLRTPSSVQKAWKDLGRK